MTIVKICDVRDYATAEMCAALGVALVGLHARHLVDRSKAAGLIETADRAKDLLPSLGLVVVTQSNTVSAVVSECHTLRPDYVQLHSPDWTPPSIKALGLAFAEAGLQAPKIITFVRVPASSKKISELASTSHALLLDMTDYRSPRPEVTPPPAAYLEASKAAAGRPVLVAGGLNPENVGAYVGLVHPWGVDVQRGVEFPGPGGRKNPEMVEAFVTAVRHAERGA
jgi:phosphoribosylanthranilate isomerase